MYFKNGLVSVLVVVLKGTCLRHDHSKEDNIPGARRGNYGLHQKKGEEVMVEKRFTIEMKKLKNENQRLRIENASIKKLEEIKRRSR